MGDHNARRESEEVQLQRESEELLAQLMSKLDELDRVRARDRGRHASPAERRRAFRVIQGGATVVGAAVIWAWETARRPSLAVAAGTGAVATGAFIAVPSVEPGTHQPPPPVVVPASPQPERTPIVVEAELTSREVDETEQPSGTAEPEPTRTMSEPVATPKPAAQADEPAAATPKPTATTTAKATVEAEPVGEAEVSAEVEETIDVCVKGQLLDEPLGLCVSELAKLGR